MIGRKNYLLIICLMVSTAVFAQKKPLTHDVYDDWKSIQTVNISNNGQWAAYRIAPQEGDAVLELRNLNNNETIRVERVSRYTFSTNGKFVAAEVKPEHDKVRELKLKKTSGSKMPKDSLYIVNLESGDMKKVARVKNYQLPEDSEEWIAWLHEKPLDKPKKKEEKTEEAPEETGKKKKKKRNKKKEEPKAEEAPAEPKDPREKSKGTELVLYNMATGETKSFTGVMEYSLSDKGNILVYEYDEVDSLAPSGIHALNIASGESFELNSGLVGYKKITIDEEGTQVAFFGSASEKDAEDKYYSLFHWTAGGEAAQIVADTTTAGTPENWMVSDNSRISFSESGKRLYFGTAPRPVKYAYESDTTLLKEDKPAVDVWSYNDPYIQPMQKLQATREKNRTYSAYIDVETGKMVQLADLELESVRIDTEKDMDFFLASTDKPYRVQYTWDTQTPSDIYLVDAETGDADLLMKGTMGAWQQLSPNGKYITWYDLNDTHWYAMDLATKTTKNLTENIPVSFANELHDSPSLAYAYGTAGWTEGDKEVFINDRYDIWKINPATGDFENVTNGEGRANKITFRYQRLDREEEYVPTNKPVLLSASNEWTKASGYYTTSMASADSPKEVLMKDMSVYGLDKAKNADRVLLRMSTYEEYPEVYTASSTALSDIQKLTDLDAQEDPYNWGSNELIEFASGYDGETMQAILYKPENFDPNKKYPMIVYFYERRSNSLHSHPSPAPSASTVNIPYYVSNDYLVLVPDIKYEIGHPGKSAMDHVVPATQAVVDMGFVDKDKMAIQGQSWGGYQVAHIVTKTDMYAAAGAGAPVSNMTSAYGGVRWGSGMSRMFQYEKTQSRIGGTLWDEFDLYIENSPVFGVPNINTPLFIMHNDADGAVPWYQGIEFYMALRRLQKPSWMVVYNDEAHNLRLRKNRKDLSIRMGQFFDHYLKGAPMPEWMAHGLPATLKDRTLRYELVDESKEKLKEGESLNIEKGNK